MPEELRTKHKVNKSAVKKMTKDNAILAYTVPSAPSSFLSCCWVSRLQSLCLPCLKLHTWQPHSSFPPQILLACHYVVHSAELLVVSGVAEWRGSSRSCSTRRGKGEEGEEEERGQLKED